MTWDATAYQVCLCALGNVEASMNYGAVNPSDVISVGILQWYSHRAANILNLMMTTNAPDWVGVPSSLTTDLTTYPATDDFWASRYPTKSEINALGNVMTTTGNVLIQDTQAYADIDKYLAVAAKAGLDKDSNTDTAAFYCNIYNRNPSAAGRIIGNCGPTSSLSRILSYTLNDSTESNYRSRYQLAYHIISTHDTTGVGVGTPPTGGGGDGGNPGNGQISGNASYITERGTQLHLQNKDGTILTFHRVSSGGNTLWLSSQDVNVGGGTPPPNGGGTPPTGAIADIIAWEESVIGTFDYSEGAGRLDPVASGTTDCSGLQYYAFLTYGNIDIGTWTGEQYTTGTLVTKDPTVAKDGVTVVPGDLVLYRWGGDSPSHYDHTALYKGSDTVISHGGPGVGPHEFSHSGYVDLALSGSSGSGGPGSIMVRRHIT